MISPHGSLHIIDHATGRSIPSRSPKPPIVSIVRAQSHLTLTRFRAGKGPFREVLSNRGPISTAVFDDIKLHESPEWGSSKVPM